MKPVFRRFVMLASRLDAYIVRYGAFCAHDDDTIDYSLAHVHIQQSMSNYELTDCLSLLSLCSLTVITKISDRQCFCITFSLWYAVQDVVAMLFDEHGSL